jgi:hypothetical protein
MAISEQFLPAISAEQYLEIECQIPLAEVYRNTKVINESVKES